MPKPKQRELSLDEARTIGELLYLDWTQVDLKLFHRGLMGHRPPRSMDRQSRSGYSGLFLAGKAVMAHMRQFPDYAIRLARLRAEARHAGVTNRYR